MTGNAQGKAQKISVKTINLLLRLIQGTEIAYNNKKIKININNNEHSKPGEGGESDFRSLHRDGHQCSVIISF